MVRLPNPAITLINYYHTRKLMTEKITATVTRENWRQDFKNRRDYHLSTDCIVARALREATGDEWIVGMRDATKRRDYCMVSSVIRYRLDRRTQKMISRWMSWGSIARYLSRPFTFTIEQGEI
jgi:hypothetical protein